MKSANAKENHRAEGLDKAFAPALMAAIGLNTRSQELKRENRWGGLGQAVALSSAQFEAFPAGTAPPPEEVKPYVAEKYVAPTQVTVLPRPVSTEIPQDEYPPDALAQGLEASVVLRLLVDETGRVAEATALGDPGNGFAEAAVRIASTGSGAVAAGPQRPWLVPPTSTPARNIGRSLQTKPAARGPPGEGVLSRPPAPPRPA